ncbi:hypothetical protein NX059_011413 [Plenodomus lindquistii]|nr:hypothetical protein NX059_011413 [Plenodomus lindquistii]
MRSSHISTLETSSPSTPTSPVQAITHTAIPTPAPNLQILHDVLSAENYITHCTIASPYRNNASGKPLPLPLIFQSILHPTKYRHSLAGKPQPPSWFRCHMHTWTAVLTFRFPPQAWAIYSHLRSAQLLDPLSGPFMSWAALTYQPLPSCTAVMLASSLLVDAPTRPKKVWLGWYYAALDLAVHVVVIVQLELTLKWNRVSGLDVLWGSVGQLIPFVIGVGGLGLVVVRWGARMVVKKRNKVGGWDGGLEGEKKGGGRGRENEGGLEAFGLDGEVRQGYERWKKSLGDHGSFVTTAES